MPTNPRGQRAHLPLYYAILLPPPHSTAGRLALPVLLTVGIAAGCEWHRASLAQARVQQAAPLTEEEDAAVPAEVASDSRNADIAAHHGTSHVFRPVAFEANAPIVRLPPTQPREPNVSLLSASDAVGSPPLVLALAEARGMNVAFDEHLPHPIDATVPVKMLDLMEALERLRASPRMAALRAEVDIVRAERIQAGLLPNPEFTYERFFTLTGDPDAANDPDFYFVGQPLLLFGQRGVAVQTANLEISATQADVLAEYADLVVELRRLFATLLVRQEAVRLLEGSLGDFERVERVVQGRWEAGDVSRYDLERIRVEVSTFRTRLVAAQAKLAAAAGEMAQLIGSSEWAPRAAGEARPLGTEFRYGELREAMTGVHPRILAARNQELAARGRIALARIERLPVPTLEMGWWQAQAPTPNFAGALYAGVSVPTPVFDRGQGSIARANAETRARALERQAVIAETEAALHAAIQVLQHLRSTLDIYEQQIREQLPNLRRMAEEGYRVGEIRIVELLDAVNLFVEPQLSYLELLETVMHAEIDVLSAAGLVEAYLDIPEAG